jgi:hypothetical protein
MKITKQQLKQIIKEETNIVLKESPKILNEIRLSDDEEARINVGDFLQIYDAGIADYRILNLGKVPKYNYDHGHEGEERIIVRVVNIDQVGDPRDHTEPRSALVNEIQIAAVLQGITRQDGMRLKAIELTQDYLLALNNLGGDTKTLTDFMNQLASAKEQLN